MMTRPSKICYTVFRPGLKPACSFASNSSTLALSRLKITRGMILLGWLIRLVVLEFWHCLGLPFFGKKRRKKYDERLYPLLLSSLSPHPIDKIFLPYRHPQSSPPYCCMVGSTGQYHQHHHQFLNCEGRWGTTDDFATSFLHFPLFSIALWDLPNSRPVHSLMLSFHLFLCPPCPLPPFTVPCKMVLARPDERET